MLHSKMTPSGSRELNGNICCHLIYRLMPDDWLMFRPITDRHAERDSNERGNLNTVLCECAVRTFQYRKPAGKPLQWRRVCVFLFLSHYIVIRTLQQMCVLCPCCSVLTSVTQSPGGRRGDFSEEGELCFVTKDEAQSCL